MLNVFLGRTKFPDYRLVPPPNGELQKLIVKEDVRNTSPFFFNKLRLFGLIVASCTDD